jgi:hypothetical protein
MQTLLKEKTVKHRALTVRDETGFEMVIGKTKGDAHRACWISRLLNQTDC